MLLGAWVVLASSAHAGLPGDVFPDCEIDVADAVLLERSLAGLVTLTNEQATNANLTPIGGVRDVVVDAGDLVTLKRWLAGEGTLPTPAYTAPILDPITTDGETNPITVSGTAQTGVSGLEVVLYVNGRALPGAAPVDQTTGGFHFGVGNELKVPLFDGHNEITAIVRKGNFDHSCSSESVETEYHPDSAAVLSVPQQTIASGSLPASIMVWTPELLAGTDDTITVTTSSLTIASGQKLYIMPGVDMKFGNGLKLIVASGGYLQILGSPGNEIELSQNGTCGTVRWGGIEVSSSTVPPRPLINFARILCTTTGLSVLSGGNATINNSEIADFTTAGVSTASTGVNFAGINFNTITSAASAIGIHDKNDNTFIRGNTISVTGASGVGIKTYTTQFTGAFPPSRWVVEQNIITGSGRAGIEIDVAGSNGNDTVFSQNTITNNCRGVLLSSFNARPRPHFIGNSIHGNNNCTSCTGNACKDYTYDEYLCTSGSPALPQAGWLDATGNWWGSTNPTFIQGRIDQPCTQSAPIDYTPFLSARHDEVPFWIGAPLTSVLYGEVDDTDDPPPPAGSDWILLRDTVVPAGKTLTIPDGQVLRFAREAALIVQGTLIVQDLNGSDVVFTGLAPPGGSSERGDWKGIIVEATGSASIDDAVIRYAKIGVEAQRTNGSARAHVTVRDSTIDLFSQAGVVLDRVSNASAVIDTLIDGTISEGPPVVSAKDGATRNVTGIRITDSTSTTGCTPTCVEIIGNTIQRLVTGIHVQGDSKPEILDNVVTENIWGIWLEWLTSGEPKPVIQQNQIFANQGATPFASEEPDEYRFCTNSTSVTAGSNLCLSSYTSSGTALQIDARQNYWGTVTESEVRDGVRISHGNRIPVDQSEFLDENGVIVGPADLLSAVLVNISAVGASSIGGVSAANLGGPVMRPTLVSGEDLDITYHLLRAANITIEIFGETEDTTTATPTRVMSLGSRAVGGPHIDPWNGRNDATQLVPDGAYVYVITARHPTTNAVLDRYDPARNSGVFNGPLGINIHADRGFGQPQGTYPNLLTFNSFVNDFLTYDYQLIQLSQLPKPYSSRVTAEVVLRQSGDANTCDASQALGTIIARPWNAKPLWVGHHTFLWDGRAEFAAGGFSVGELVPEVVQGGTDFDDFCLFFRVPGPLKPNHVIVANVSPTVSGTGTVPEIEVKSDPLFIQPTYDQSSALTFKVDQPAIVTLKILPPGELDLAEAVITIPIDGDPGTTGVQPVLPPASPAFLPFTYYWLGSEDDPNPATLGETNELRATFDGPYTFALLARSPDAPDTPQTTSVYRGVIHVRGEGQEP